MRKRQIEAKYYYGIGKCSDCEKLESYVHALFLDEKASCGTSADCVTVKGSSCVDDPLYVPCAEITIISPTQPTQPPKIAFP